MDNDLDLKFLAIGDSGVGKTCLLNQYVDGNYNEKLAPTVGIDIRDKNIDYESHRSNSLFKIHLQLWDTAGQERFRSLTSSFFRDAYGFLLVFDLTNETSFINVRNWITEIGTNAYSENVDIILVGNKCDLESSRVISKLCAEEFAQQHKIKYIETSALKNIHVEESVKLLLDLVMDRLEQSQDFSKPSRRQSKSTNEPINNLNFDNNKRKNARVSYCCSY
ncbi:unnamed protein product [Rotaria socialis]|uniref:Uncharacterized protein n=1 Tax=Rotaria socialis TaxID=392032 RepID=A0A818LT31_9BILA|nr:unnamed protein product [Rotaria socialis]CAF3417461.1 unnamed protein product [Rotaria socialis]CAF3578365.1 unnamed protein product [Rotaria socialis]CAF3709792.1 unnamed protein product [Rotaria socialis]CAF4139270.1 unnamed protein product [Rotaria socialis]